MRIAARVAVFGLIGAVATVLVASVVVEPALGGGAIAGTWQWPTAAPSSWPPVATQYERKDSAWATAEAWYDLGTDWYVMARHEHGVPLRALRSQDQLSTVMSSKSPTGSWRSDGIQVLDRTIPLTPLWPGFAVDTAFWGGAAFIVWSVPGFVRRRVRRRRGRCVRCGYELAGMAVCPECGQ